MNADERQEIAASVAAHAELGPRYDGAVAEGLWVAIAVINIAHAQRR